MFFMQGGMPGMPGMSSGFPGGMFGGPCGSKGSGKGGGKGFFFDNDDDDDGDEFGGDFSMGASDEGSSTSKKKGVDNTRLYSLLGVEPSASSADIKKAYHRMARTHHPDKGGDPETFKDIGQAFEVLSDEDMRKRYDKLGEEGLKDDGPSGPEDIFDKLFGGGGGAGRRGNQRTRTRDQVRPMWVTLEELFTSVTRNLPHNRKVVDEGSENQACQACEGKGHIVQTVRMGPIVQQMQHPCPVCRGAGSSAKLRTEREVIPVFVEKGSPDGHKIVFHGKADEAPGCDAGDLVVVVKEQDHPRFLRKGADLYLEREVTLAEALTGLKIVVKHLDGRKWIIRSKPGEVLQPQQGGVALKAVAGGGMPIHQDPFSHGNLFLVLSIRFPLAVEPAAAAELRRLLGGPEGEEEEASGASPCPTPGAFTPSALARSESALSEADQEAVLEDIDPLESSKAGRKPGAEAYDEDADDGPGGMKQVQCNQQ